MNWLTYFPVESPARLETSLSALRRQKHPLRALRRGRREGGPLSPPTLARRAAWRVISDPAGSRAPSHPRIPCTCASAQLHRAQHSSVIDGYACVEHRGSAVSVHSGVVRPTSRTTRRCSRRMAMPASSPARPCTNRYLHGSLMTSTRSSVRAISLCEGRNGVPSVQIHETRIRRCERRTRRSATSCLV